MVWQTPKAIDVPGRSVLLVTAAHPLGSEARPWVCVGDVE